MPAKAWSALLLAALLWVARADAAPPYIFEWAKLGAASDPSRTSVQRAEGAVACIRFEIEKPSEGPFDELGPMHTRILEKMLEYLSHPSSAPMLDRETMRKAMRTAPPGELRDVLTILGGHLGLDEARAFLAAYVRDGRRPPHLRRNAVTALGVVAGDAETAILVEIAERDAVQMKSPKRSIIGCKTLERVYPVRLAAIGALRTVHRKGKPLPEATQQRLRAVVTHEELDD
jgi:hypothetical protein